MAPGPCLAHSRSVCLEVLSPGHGFRKERPKYDPERVRGTPSRPGAGSFGGTVPDRGADGTLRLFPGSSPLPPSPISGRNWKPFLCSVMALRLAWQIR